MRRCAHTVASLSITESWSQNERTFLVESLAWKASLCTHLNIYTNGITCEQSLKKMLPFFVQFIPALYFPGSFSDYDIATWGWFMLVLDTWFEYGTESRLLSDDWSIISLSSSSLQLSRSSSLLPGKPLTDEPFALVWIPLGWREGLEGS